MMEKGKKIKETVLINETGGKSHRLLPEKVIVEFLMSFKRCRFCGGTNLKKDKSYHSLILTCQDCGFQITSSHLYNNSIVEEGMTTIGRVVYKVFEEEIEKHKKELTKRLVAVSLERMRVENALAAHYAF